MSPMAGLLMQLGHKENEPSENTMQKILDSQAYRLQRIVQDVDSFNAEPMKSESN